jgi:hypothetical protein
MARFMLAHLNNGTYNGVAILRPETVERMHSRVFSLVEDMNGFAHGFYETSRNGQRVIGHGGNLYYFHSTMHLLLEQGIGLYLSYNSIGNQPNPTCREMVYGAFCDRYFPHTPLPAESTPPPAQLEEENKALESALGAYWPSRRGSSTIAAFLYSKSESTLTQQRGADGEAILIMKRSALTTNYAGVSKRFQRIAPMRWREVNGQSRLALIADPAGDGGWMVVTDVPIFELQQVPQLMRRGFNTVQH